MEYMDGTIKTEKHLNEDAFLLENDVLSVKILKNFGAKIASIYSKEKNFEFLFQPTKGEYEVPVLRDAFEKYDTSGADDMLPTIDECFYPNSYIKLPDHGDVWAQKWNYEVEDNKLIAWIRSDSLKLILKRTMYLEDNALVLEYSLKNNTLQKHYYLWAFHGLMNFDDNTEMYFDFSGEIENVIDATEYGFDFKKLYEYPDKSQNKFYFKNEVVNGSCGLIYKNQGLKLQYDFDTNTVLNFLRTYETVVKRANEINRMPGNIKSLIEKTNANSHKAQIEQKFQRDINTPTIKKNNLISQNTNAEEYIEAPQDIQERINAMR